MKTNSQSQMKEAFYDSEFLNHMKDSSFEKMIDADSEAPSMMMAKVASLTAKWEGRSVPRPEHWGGLRVSLDEIEFWQGRDGRLHDRIRYTSIDSDWSWERLQP